MTRLNLRAAAAFLALAAGLVSAPLAAQETGFVEERAIQQQIFDELKASFDDLYRNVAAEAREAEAAAGLEEVDASAELPMRKVARKGNGGSGVTL